MNEKIDKRTSIVCFCGSSRFVDIMAVVAWLVERDEEKITVGLHLLPQWYPNVPPDHLAESEGVAEQMDELHLRKIDLADEVYVINWNDYIGESTRREVAYSVTHKKPIRYLLSEPDHLDFIEAALAETEKRDK